MVKEEFEKNILFEKFDLESDEVIIAKKIVTKYADKMKNFVAYQKIKLEMKSHLKAKNKHFEVKGHVFWNGDEALSEAEGTNPFVLINEVMEKILHEIEHKIGKKQ